MAQDQDVDIRIGVQLASAVAADCNQRQPLFVGQAKLLPALCQQLIDEQRTGCHQFTDRAAGQELLLQPELKCRQRLTATADGQLAGGEKTG